MAVNDVHEEYKKYQHDWRCCRDAVEGQSAIHKAGTKYLSKLTDQTDEEYKSYKLRAPFYEASGRTVIGLGGMIFRKEPIIEENGMTEFVEDVCLDGTDLIGFAKGLVDTILTVGRAGILVDYPENQTDDMTEAQAQALNMRPFLKEYKTEAIINWRIGRVNNKAALTQVRLMEHVEEIGDDEFDVVMIEQIRVLEITEAGTYQHRIFRKDEEKESEWVQFGEAITPMVSGKALDYIPFIFVSATDLNPSVDRPPLMGLVNLNISHYKTTADFEHGAHFTGLPTAVITGHTVGDGEEFRIGSATAWIFDDPNADAKYLEFTGQGLSSLSESMKEKEEKMAALGAQMLTPSTRRNEAAETAEIRHLGENSILSSISMTISDALNKALEYAAPWIGQNVTPATITLNTDFMATGMTPQKLTALIQSWQSGGISKQTLFYNLQKGEIIDAMRTFEDEENDIETEIPTGMTGGDDV